jgi:hypothetical protein
MDLPWDIGQDDPMQLFKTAGGEKGSASMVRRDWRRYSPLAGGPQFRRPTLAAIDVIFTNEGVPLEFDVFELDLDGLDLILQHLKPH